MMYNLPVLLQLFSNGGPAPPPSWILQKCVDNKNISISKGIKMGEESR